MRFVQNCVDELYLVLLELSKQADRAGTVQSQLLHFKFAFPDVELVFNNLFFSWLISPKKPSKDFR